MRHQRNLRTGPVFAAMLCVAGIVAVPGSAVAQQNVTEVDAEVVSVGEKGRLKTLTVKSGDDELEVILNPKIKVEILAAGDDGFLRPGQMIQATGIVSNENFFGEKFIVYPHFKGRVPAARAVKAPSRPGASQNEWIVSGQIVGREEHESGKYDVLQLKQTAVKSMPILAEQNREILVQVNDLSMVEPGMPAKVRGVVTGQRFTPREITITLPDELKAEEFLKEADEEDGEKE